MRPRLLLLIAATMVLVSSCELQANLRLELVEDGSGMVIARFGLDDEFQELVESSGESVEDSIFEDNEILGEIPGAQQRVYEEGDFTWYEASAPFANINALDSLVAADESGENPLAGLDIVVDEERAVVSGSIPLDDFAAQDDEFGGIDPEALTEFFSISVQILMPGEVTSHNADRVLADGALEWDIPLFTTQAALEIEAESDPAGGGGFSIGLLIGSLAVVAALVLGGLWWSRRRRSREAEPAVVGAAAIEVADDVVTDVPGLDTPATPDTTTPPADAGDTTEG